MHVALTGTPGTGKTTLAGIARGQGWDVIDLKQWAGTMGAVVGHDDADDADVIDVDALRGRLPVSGDRRVLVEGHLAHALDVDVVWIVRCDPEVLRGRLQQRGYSEAKVRENLEAEALDIILQEALDQGVRVVQRDGTRRSPEALWQTFVEASPDQLKGHDLEAVDWSHRLPIGA